MDDKGLYRQRAVLELGSAPHDRIQSFGPTVDPAETRPPRYREPQRKVPDVNLLYHSLPRNVAGSLRTRLRGHGVRRGPQVRAGLG